jgi:hypothetical protein
MDGLNSHGSLRAVVRQLGLLLLLAAVLIQALASTVSAATHGVTQDPAVMHMQADCDMHSSSSPLVRQGVDHTGAEHDTADHCAATICCFHDTPTATNVTFLATLLPIAPVIERRAALSSHLALTEDRPPRLI